MTVEAQAVGRVRTGSADLDRLLLGGFPEGYAIALTSPPFDERLELIERYVAAGPRNGQTTFYLTADPGSTKVLAEEFPSSMYLFVCNARADLMVKDLSNVYKLKGVDNLTDIDISLAKASRQLDSSQKSSRRACVEIVSDALLQHHAVNTRKWLSGLIQDLKSKGFTILAVINPQMHPSEEVQSILSLFDGEIKITEKETPQGVKQTLRVKRLSNQKFLDNELALDKKKLEQ
jgi:KaiC/GvpD/RAD55 family RecA-like ATPase